MRGKRFFLAAILAMAVTVAGVWLAHRAVEPRQPTWGDVQEEARAGGYRLITSAGLADLRRAGGALLVDTRQEWEFRTGHIQGARNFPMEPTRLERWRKAGALAAFLGPDKDRDIVFY